MNKTIIRIAIAALTFSLLALPVAAGAQETSGLTDTHRIKFMEENLWDFEESDQIAHYEIYVEQETNISDEIRFIEANQHPDSSGYTIDVHFLAQPVGNIDKPDGINDSDWFRFLEANLWDLESGANYAEKDKLTAYTALCQGEDRMMPLERAFSDYADDVRDYCRNSSLASYAEAQGEGFVDSVNKGLNPY